MSKTDKNPTKIEQPTPWTPGEGWTATTEGLRHEGGAVYRGGVDLPRVDRALLGRQLCAAVDAGLRGELTAHIWTGGDGERRCLVERVQ